MSHLGKKFQKNIKIYLNFEKKWNFLKRNGKKLKNTLKKKI